MNRIVHDYAIVLDSPLGRLGVCLEAGHVTRLNYLTRNWRLRPAETQLEQGVVKQLDAYFNDPRRRFTLPLAMHGTPFQLRVWQALQSIPPGTTVTYGQLAERLDSGARAVGNACRRNPISIIVPCHRVTGAAGVGGYGGKTDGTPLVRKQWLLRHESREPGLKTA
ncbi:MAG TPA: methylated-DNA--[protein]-cysteine S-methyltransferase [Gammaproteobacteria bacterium]|nr:methylated-DNA--[protein]-cysteine S-methyltransferase [Gammaproteobacteria bacterium]